MTPLIISQTMTTNSIATIFGIAFISTVLATPAAKWLGTQLGLVDNPDNYRKIHKNAIPLGGGIAVFFGFVVPILFSVRFSDVNQFLPQDATDMIVMLIVGGSTALLMGLADDLRNLKARWKIVFQILAALLAYSGGFRIDSISSPFGASIELGYIGFLVTMLWFLVCMNAINLADGLDGLSAGIGFIVSLTLLGVNIAAGNTLGILLNACLSGALLGFLIFNFNPASIFLGDSGSMFIGFLVAAISLLTKNKAETATALLIPLMALGLPIYDMAIAIVRRWAGRNPISVADKRHIHHSLLSLGFSHRETVVVLYCISIALCLASVIMVLTRSQYSALILVLLVLAIIIGTRVLKLINMSELRSRLRQDHEEHLWRKAVTLDVEKAVQQATLANSTKELYECFTSAFVALELDKAELHLVGDQDEAPLIWRTPQLTDLRNAKEQVERDTWQLKLMIRSTTGTLGHLSVIKRGGIRKTKNLEIFIDRIRNAIQLRLGPINR